jgi:hypothetical protein
MPETLCRVSKLLLVQIAVIVMLQPSNLANLIIDSVTGAKIVKGLLSIDT